MACITIANVFWVKDILLGKKPMSNGEMLFWPSKMIYAPKVCDYMRNAGINNDSLSSFLRDSPTTRPLIIFSFASKINTDHTFEEANTMLQSIIHGAVDDGSNTTPRKLFSLVVKTASLLQEQMPPLIAISAVIGPVHPDYMPEDDQEDSNMPVYIGNTVANNNEDNDDANDNANEDDEVDDDGGAAEGNNDD